MPRKSRFPDPKRKYHKGAWEIYWNWNLRRYSFAPGFQSPDDEPFVEACRRQIAAALASDEPAFPERWADAAGVKRYLADRHGIKNDEAEAPFAGASGSAILDAYKQNLARHCAKTWSANSYAMVKGLDDFIDGGFQKTTKTNAIAYLEHVIVRGLSANTRNHYLAACSRFFKWCIENGITKTNPFFGIKRMKVADIENIVYCTRSERERILAVATGLGRPDWVAIPIAFYAGCRREEIFRLDWSDINLDGRRIVIRKSKTGKQRTVPITQSLADLLATIKREYGPVVPPAEGQTWANQADRLVELIRESLCRPENPDETGRAKEVVGKRRFLYTPEDARALPDRIAEMERQAAKTKNAVKKSVLKQQLSCLKKCPEMAWDGAEWIPSERVRWNAWRHTFGSLLAQKGVGIDKISSWMGNTPEVCRRHYAQFVPRDRHDEEIDLL